MLMKFKTQMKKNSDGNPELFVLIWETRMFLEIIIPKRKIPSLGD